MNLLCSYVNLHAHGKCFGSFCLVPNRDLFERFYTPSVVQVQDGIELFKQVEFGITVILVRERSVNNANAPLQARFGESGDWMFAQVEEEFGLAATMKQLFVAARRSGRKWHLSRWGIPPVQRRGDGAVMSSETDQQSVISVLFANELAHANTAVWIVFFGALIADMRVVCPDHDL